MILGAFVPFSKNLVPCFESVVGLISVELHLSGLIGTASHQDKQIIRIIGFVSENRLHWQLVVRLLLFTVCT
jgi:hypothetical protein